ncbi:hypothetical protein TIFTF001_030704 [Ficus carica]|uniref:Uncharacterized protein n=1 Tax=Ficus carica TaxID=3494 RepID=A0AA88DTX3_FICCA|nr:hypothetical protein TIFTF001_030704 [Ficus carica]
MCSPVIDGDNEERRRRIATATKLLQTNPRISPVRRWGSQAIDLRTLGGWRSPGSVSFDHSAISEVHNRLGPKDLSFDLCRLSEPEGRPDPRGHEVGGGRRSRT